MDMCFIGENKEIYRKAISVGCNPLWYDGIFGWAWHCGCKDLRHTCDSQCSMLTMNSLERE